MKIESPPKFEDINFDKYFEFINENKDGKDFLNQTDEKYFYWSDIKYRPNLPFNNPVDAWQIIKAHRYLHSEEIELRDHVFTYNLTSFIQADLHNFDIELISGLKNSITPKDQAEYFKNSLLEEAIASSQIEGAATTTDVARKMIKSGRNPRNESEQIINELI